MKRFIFLFTIILLSSITCRLDAQKQNNIWYFGHYAGLDFNVTPPASLTGALYTTEGNASICDSEGHLLFYSNGVEVWDRNHQIMPNGSGLLGGESSTQAALIVPLPGSSSKYYLFTTGDNGISSFGLSFSVIDMLSNNGYGDIEVSSKNTLVTDFTCEMLTAVLHPNGSDIWILTHKFNSTDFYSYLLTPLGLSNSPVISSIGSLYEANFGSTPGGLRSSHDGKKIVSAITYEGICEMFDFNPLTGEITNHEDLRSLIPDFNTYGMEFSPNDSLLYLSGSVLDRSKSYVIQIALYENPPVITTLSNYKDGIDFGALQLAPNGKIYLTRRLNSHIDVIHKPDQQGIACEYEAIAIPLDSGTVSTYGLPNPAPYSFCPLPSLGNNKTICEGDTLELVLNLDSTNNCPYTFTWFDGTSDTIKLITQPGVYWVNINNSQIFFSDSILVDSIYREHITAAICPGESYEGYTLAGTYIDTFPTSRGCDSIRHLNLSVGAFYQDTVYRTLCAGESYDGYSQSGTYRDTMPNNDCGHIRILRLTIVACTPIITYNFDACRSVMADGSHMDYSEFNPEYPNQLPCAEVEADHIYRVLPEKHSCTPGINDSPAMCISSIKECAFVPGDPASLWVDFTLNPQQDSMIRFTGLEFHEKAPLSYNWINGPNGPNDYPFYFGIRILKNGNEIFRQGIIHTNPDWTFRTFNFLNDENFSVDSLTHFSIELQPYCTFSSPGDVSAWDIDDLKIYGGCIPILQELPDIEGTVITVDGRNVPDVGIELSDHISFTQTQTNNTNEGGYYNFESLVKGHSYYLRANKNKDALNGVSTLDLLLIQKHLLGIEPFASLDQYVAADINHDGKITTIDLVHLKKLLLGLYPTFPNNTSWRFGIIPQVMNLSELSEFREIKSIESLNKSEQANFLGIKIGDLNGTVDVDFTGSGVVSRSHTVFPILFENQRTVTNRAISLPLTAGSSVNLEGLQMKLALKHVELQAILPGKLNITHDDYTIHDNLLRLIWNGPEIVEFNKNDVLFTLLLTPKTTAQLADQFQLNDHSLVAECYSPGSYLPITIDLVPNNSAVAQMNPVVFHIDPNPFRDAFNINFHLHEEEKIIFRFYDMTGQLLHTIEKAYSIGEHVERVDIKGVGNHAFVYCQMIVQRNAFVQKAVSCN